MYGGVITDEYMCEIAGLGPAVEFRDSTPGPTAAQWGGKPDKAR
jgi:hypothetical protein